jgi:hypothetical protein
MRPSKKVENHNYAVALQMINHNFVRVRSKLRMFPEMVAGVLDHLWEVSDIAALIEAEEAKAGRQRGPYIKQVPA